MRCFVPPALLLCVLASPLGQAVAQAQDGQPAVVVLRVDGAAWRPGFVEALRIQLVDARVATAAPSPAEPSVPARVDRAREVLAERDATLAVWVEGPGSHDAGGELLLYVVGAQQHRALLDVVAFVVPRADADC